MKGSIPLAGPAIVAEAHRARAGKPEEIYRAWLELAPARPAAEQMVLSGYTLHLADQQIAGEGELFAVVGFFDGLAAQLFTRQTDVGELSNYIAADARRWRDLLRALRQRSRAAHQAPRYHDLTRALAAAEFLASEPIADAEREHFALTDVGAQADESGRTAEISANFIIRPSASKPAPNIAICLRDAGGDVCGEAVFAPPEGELFTAKVHASAEIANIEASLTRRAVG